MSLEQVPVVLAGVDGGSVHPPTSAKRMLDNAHFMGMFMPRTSAVAAVQRSCSRMAGDRVRAALLVGLACVLLLQPVKVLGQELKNIRPRDAVSELLLRLAQERSQSFRELVASLEQSPIVVYVEVRRDPKHPRSCRLRFIGDTGGRRSVSASLWMRERPISIGPRRRYSS